MSKSKKIYVIGHKNPDTDSIVSAIAYARLKNELGFQNCFPARAGKITDQTGYVLNRFGFEPPELIADLIPKVENYMSFQPVTISLNTPLWHALAILNSNNFKMLPIVDGDNRYVSLLHYNAFAKFLITNIHPIMKIAIPTSIHHLIAVLTAKPVVVFDEQKIFNAQVCIAAYDIESFKEHISTLSTDGLIVTVGDRCEIQRYVIEQKVHALIVTGNKTVSDEIKELAGKNGVSLLLSPFDTSVTSMLIFYSTPVRYVGDKSVKPVKRTEYIDNIREVFFGSVSKSICVVDEGNGVIGVITWSDLLEELDTEVIMVDHNEVSQAVTGLQYCKILEIIDHHRLGNIHTSYPITFINKPVGSTSTIIASLYRDYGVPLKKEIASLLLAGILSDTIILRSDTTTEIDRSMAKHLAEIGSLSIAEFGRDIMTFASLVSKRPANEIIDMDMKKYEEGKCVFTISQIEVSSVAEILDKRNDILTELERIRSMYSYYFSALLVTDITKLDSVLFIAGDMIFISKLGYKKMDEGQFFLKGLLSRKKQLVPLLVEIIKKNLR